MSLNPQEFARAQRAVAGPAWRSVLAEKLSQQSSLRWTDRGDDVLRDFVRYLRLRRREGGGTRSEARYPWFAAAEKLNADPEQVAALKLMTVVDLPRDEMHRRSGVAVDALRAWEQLFYDVRNQRKAVLWLARQVINRETKAGAPELAAKLRLAVCAGPVAVRGMLDMQQGVCLDEADRLFQRKLKLCEKLDLAVNLRVDTCQNSMFFVKTHFALMAEEKRLALAERKLAQRCAEARDRFELGKLRLQQAAEFQALRESARFRKVVRRAAAKAERLRAEQELGRRQAEAARAAMQRRILESPLGRLRWGAPATVRPEVASDVREGIGRLAPPERAVESSVHENSSLSIDAVQEAEVGPGQACLVAAV